MPSPRDVPLRRRVAAWLEDRARHGSADAALLVLCLEGMARLGMAPGYLYHAAGILHAAAGRQAAAEAAQGRAIEAGAGKHVAAAWLRRAQSQLSLGAYAAAEASARAAIAANPRAHAEWYVLLHALSLQGRLAEGLDELIAVARNLPGSDGTLPLPLPWFYFTEAVVDVARAEALRHVVDRHPQSRDANIALSMMENWLGNYTAGTRWMRRAAALHWPDFAAEIESTDDSFALHKEPSFLIIGQAKAATTSLFEGLCEHPDLDPPVIKEPQYWSARHDWGIDCYRANFPPRRHRPTARTFEASTTYFVHPEAPRRIAEAAPDMRCIVVLREPVARAYAEFQMNVRLGLERRTWEDVVDGEIARFGDCPLDRLQLEQHDWGGSPLLRSAALPHLQRWLAVLPAAQMLVLRQRDFAHHAPAILRRVCEFVGLAPWAHLRLPRVNEGSYPAMPRPLAERLHHWFAAHEAALDRFLDERRGLLA